VGVSALDLVRAMLSGVNVPPVVAEEACARTGLEKGKVAKTLSEKELEKLHSVLHGFYSAEFPPEKPCVVEHLGKKVLLPFEPKGGIQIIAEFDSVNAGLNEIILTGFLTPIQKEDKRKIELERAVAEQKTALAQCEASVIENKKKAELIYGHYAAIMPAVLELRAFSEQKEAKHAIKPVMYNKVFGRALLIQADLKNKKALFELPDA
jgi:predicted ribosome quality control (RQC) complex YloA/Tae2 family protein